jgi:hypothetical protein
MDLFNFAANICKICQIKNWQINLAWCPALRSGFKMLLPACGNRQRA